MDYVLYGDRRSGSAAVELALAEIGAEVELRTTSLDEDVQRSDAYRAINAQRKLPTLVTPEGELLTESAAILIVLDERHPEATLLPSGGAERAQALRWLLFIATELYPLIEIIDYPERFLPTRPTPGSDARDALRQRIRDTWRDRLLRLEAAASAPWFLGETFTMTDLYLAVVSQWAQVDAWRREHAPRLTAIAARVAERAGCRPVWRRHFG
ncbi:MAG: glutathione S-transferase family protein [Pseudomonadota bacterium]